MLCPSCSASSLDAYGRCPNCGYSAAPPARPYAAYYPQPALITPTAPAGVGLAAQILLAVSGLLALVAFGVNIWAFTVAKTAFDTNGGNYDATRGAALAAGVVIFLIYLLNLATGIVFIIWFFKSARLAAILAPGQQALPAGWAIGGWFVPLAFFVLPRVVAGGIWRSAVPLEAYPTGRRPRTYLVTWWWLPFSVAQFFYTFGAEIGTTKGDSASSVAELVGAYGFNGFVGLCGIASAILGIIMIRKISAMQQIRILQGPGVGHPYAAPVAATAPYAAYMEPQAPYGAGAPTGMPYPGAQAPYGAGAPVQAQVPPLTQPQAPAFPAQTTPAAPVSQPQDTVPAATPYQASVPPPRATAPQGESVPAATPAEPVVPAAAGTSVAASAPEQSEPVPSDEPPAHEPPAAVIPHQAGDNATVVLAAVPAPAQPVDATPAPAKAAAASGTEPQDAVPDEPQDQP